MNGCVILCMLCSLFLDFPNTGSFCINGLFGPDRMPHPSAFEAAAVQAPVSFYLHLATPVDVQKFKKTEENASGDAKGGSAAAEGKEFLCLVMQNLSMHVNLSDVHISVSLHCDTMDGTKILPDPVAIMQGDVPPGEASAMTIADLWPTLIPNSSVDVEVPSTENRLLLLAKSMNVTEKQLRNARELWFSITAKTTKATDWVPLAHTIAHVTLTHPYLMECLNKLIIRQPQRAVSHINTKKLSSNEVKYEVIDMSSGPRAGDIEFQGDEGMFGNSEIIQISWTSGAWASVGVTCGRILQWRDDKGNQMIASPIDVCLWRAPTNNDHGGAFGFDYCSQWKTVGLHCLQRIRNVDKTWFGRLRSSRNRSQIEPEAIDECAEIDDDNVPNSCVYLEASWSLAPSEQQIAAVVDAVACPCNIRVEVVYEFKSNGSIEIFTQLDISSSLPALPRVGLSFAVPQEFNSAHWLGLGPHEAYSDRRSCVGLGYFFSTINDLHVPYVVPQECASRADPR